MPLEILPRSLYCSPNIEIILKSKNTSIIFKSLSESIENKKMYLSMYAVLLVISGEQNIKNYDGTDLVVKQNEAVILPKDIYVVSDFVTEHKLFEAYVFFIDDQVIKKFLHLSYHKPILKNNKSKIVKIKTRKQIINYAKSLNKIYKENISTNSLIEIKILELLLLIELQEDSQTFISSLFKPGERRSIKKFMEENYLNNLTIKDYALLTGRSISTFNRNFKRIYGTTPKKWLIHKRLIKSHELLQTTNLNVTEVAIEVGYDNVSHFIDAYKKAYGNTPKSTRKKKVNKI
jgi:AraC-like DNA-binding protein